MKKFEKSAATIFEPPVKVTLLNQKNKGPKKHQQIVLIQKKRLAN